LTSVNVSMMINVSTDVDAIREVDRCLGSNLL
jgi:hypothetical protein